MKFCTVKENIGGLSYQFLQLNFNFSQTTLTLSSASQRQKKVDIIYNPTLELYDRGVFEPFQNNKMAIQYFKLKER